MDKLAKALAKMSDNDRQRIRDIIKKIYIRDFIDLDFKKLAGRDDIYRVRKGDWRIIFRLIKNEATILAIEKRSDNTYNF